MNCLANDTFEIGYEEDGVIWLTQSSVVPDSRSAERRQGGEWRVVEEVWLGPTGRWVNHKDPEWAECSAAAPGARRGWRLVDISTPEIFLQGEWRPNPYADTPESGVRAR